MNDIKKWKLKLQILLSIFGALFLFLVVPLILLLFVIKPYLLLSPQLVIDIKELQITPQAGIKPSATPDFSSVTNTKEFFNLKSLSPSVEERINGQLDEADRWSNLFNRSFKFVRHDIVVENKLKAKMKFAYEDSPNHIIDNHLFPTKISCEDKVNYKSINLEEKSRGIGREFTTCLNQGIAVRSDINKNIMADTQSIMVNGKVVLKFIPDWQSMIISYIFCILVWSGLVVWFDKIIVGYSIKIYKIYFK